MEVQGEQLSCKSIDNRDKNSSKHQHGLKTAMQPFRFLDLPLELQRNTLDLYYAEQATITIKYKYRPLNTIGYCAAYYIEYYYRTTISISPLLVSSHFHRETFDALKRSTNNSIEYVDGHSLKELPASFLLHTVAAAGIGLDRKIDPLLFHRVLPGLKVVRLGLHQYYLFHRVPMVLNRSEIKMIDRLNDKHDQALAEAFHEYLGRLLGKGENGVPQCPRSITLICDISMDVLLEHTSWEDECRGCGLPDQRLRAQFRFKDGKSWVENKTLRGKKDGVVRTAEEVLLILEGHTDVRESSPSRIMST